MKYYPKEFKRITEKQFLKFSEEIKRLKWDVKLEDEYPNDSLSPTLYIVNNNRVILYSEFSFALGKTVYNIHEQYYFLLREEE